MVASAFGSTAAAPELDPSAGGDELVLHACQADAVMLDIVSKVNVCMGVGDCQIVLRTLDSGDKEYRLTLVGSKKLEIKSSYKIHAGMELSDCQIKRHSVTIKMSPEQPPYLNLFWATHEELVEFKKAFSRVTRKLARPVAPKVAEVAEPEFTPLVTVAGAALALAVQPEKAAAYFADLARDVGAWEIHLANKAISTLRQMKERDIVINRIEELATGMHSGDNSKNLTKDSKGVPFYEAKTTRDQRIVYSIEIAPDEDKKEDRQIIKIWGIMTHTEVARRNWGLISRETLSRGPEYLRRCNARDKQIQRGHQKLNMPESWPWKTTKRDVEVTTSKPTDIVDRSEAEFLELHAALSLEKFVPCTKALFETLKAGTDHEMTHVFAVSALEQAIMNHQGSCFVLGRSGTGKTTSMVFRMLGVELSPHLVLDSRRLRSVFVTYSPLLAVKVKEYYQKLFHTLDLQKLSQQQRAQVDEVLRGKTGIALPPPKSSVFDMTDVGDREDEADPLPAKFSELTDEHFPLFVSYDRLLSLLEADLGLSYGRTVGEVAAEELTDELERGPSYGQLVTYETFLGAYWDHFNQTLTAGLDPALVWAEILGVIRGSEAAGSTSGGFLTKKEYEALSDRTQGTFANRRGAIYAIFDQYRKLKAERNEKDAADRTHAILDGMDTFPDRIPQIDFINVDEAQDNLIIDCKLIRGLCTNPSGYFFCGDTAQTIAAGASFRFDDLKSSFYRLEEAEPSVMDGSRRAIQPATFNLTTNYRSHGGICDAADALIGIIKNLFPNSIDNLEPEKGLVHGPLPSFLIGRRETLDQFFTSAEGNAEIEFGAQQCVLVRTEAAKAALKEQFGDRAGLIMTIPESKGLEFSDVVVYNFFADSPAVEQQWRVVLRDVPDEKAPRLDVTKHSIIGSELKKLYVALTRGRNQVHFWDSSEQVEPVKILLDHRKLIQVVHPDTPLPKIGKTSTAEEWKEAADNLQRQQKYEQAAIAYTRAMLPVQSRIATAYGKRVTVRAQKVKLGTTVRAMPQTVVDAFVSTGDAFQQAAEEAVRANLDSPGEFPDAAVQRLYRNAAELYDEGKAYAQAGKAYEKSKQYTEATIAYRNGVMLDAAVRVCRSFAAQVDVKTRERILQVAKIMYLKNPETAAKAADLFDNVDDQIEFLKDYGLAQGRLGPLLEKHGRFDEAGDVAVQEKDVERAVAMYQRAGTAEGKAKALETLLSELYSVLPFGIYKPSLNGAQVTRLRKLNNLAFTVETSIRSSTIKDSKLSPSWQELKCFQVATEDHRQKPLLVIADFLSRLDSPMAMMLALDKALEHPLLLKPDKVRGNLIRPSSVRRRLPSIQTWYIELLAEWTRIVHTPRFVDELAVQRLFGFRPAEEDATYLVLPSSFMKVEVAKARPNSTEAEVFGAVILGHLLQTAFARVAVGKLIAQEDKFRSSTLIQSPCLEQTLTLACDQPEGACPAFHGTSDREDLRQRCQIILNQICIVDHQTRFSLRVGRPHRDTEASRRFWFELLADCLYPPSSALGTATNVDLASLPNGPAGLAVLRRWLSDYFDRLNPAAGGGDSSIFFRDVQRVTLLIADLWPSDFALLCRTTTATRVVTSLETVQRRSIVCDFFSGTRTLVSSPSGRMLPSQIISGLDYIKFVLDRRLPIEVSFFVSFVEKLSVALVIGQRWNAKDRSADGLHGLFGPLSLLSHLHRSSDYRVGIPRDQLVRLVDYLKSLALQLGARPQSIWYQGRSLAPQPFAAAVFLERVLYLQTWCTWNLDGDAPFRNLVMQSLKNLGAQESYTPHELHRRYTSAEDWRDIIEKAHMKRHRSELDPVLSLQQAGKGEIKLPKKGAIKSVTFNNWDDLGYKLRVYALTDRHQVAAALSKTNGQVPTTNGAGALGGKPAPSAVGRPEKPLLDTSSTPTTPAAAATTFAESDAPEGNTVPPAQLAVAEKLASRFGSRRRNATETAALSKAELDRRTRLADFIPTAKKIVGGSGSRTAEQKKDDLLYAKLLAGPFAHLFHVLKSCSVIVGKGKRDLSKRLAEVEHLELEVLGQSINKANALNKEIVALASATNPSSPTHSLPGRSTIRLLELATKILALAQRTIALFDTNKNKVGKSLHTDMELGEKGCLRERKAKAMPSTKGRIGEAGGKKAKRPAMGRDDGRDYGDDEEDWEEEEEEEEEEEGVVGGKMPGGMDRVEE